MMGSAALDIESIHSERIESKVAERVSHAPAPAASASEVYRLVDDDLRNDLSGMRPFIRNDERYFVLRTATLICRKAGA